MRQRNRKQRDEEAGSEAIQSHEESYVDKDRAIVVNSGKFLYTLQPINISYHLFVITITSFNFGSSYELVDLPTHFGAHCLKINIIHKRMGPLQFCIPPKSSQLPKTKRIFEILWGKLEIIQFIPSDKYMDSPGRGQRHFLSKSM